MYISKITLNNFKCFKGEHLIELKRGINYFVGENNCGKTTIFKAIEFLTTNCNDKSAWITKGREEGDVSVEIELSGEKLPQILEIEKLKKYQGYIIESEGEEPKLRIMRSSTPGTWTDSKGAEKDLQINCIRVFNPTSNQFENPTGKSGTITALIDAQHIYSDLNNEDYQDFGKTKIVGKLINQVTKNFQGTEKWKSLQSAHEDAFGDEGIKVVLDDIQNKIEEILNEQYGETGVNFEFDFPGIEDFFKKGDILLQENGIETPVSEKGTGLQRALAMSLIQLYAQFDEVEEVSVPTFFFIDEPETFLHPRAQDKLVDALTKLSEKSQIFINTHSPYLLKKFNNTVNTLKIIHKNPVQQIQDGVELGIFQECPTVAEINYCAFGVCDTDFHIEVFGQLHRLAIEKNKATNGIANFDNWLKDQQNVSLTDNHHVNRNDKTMSAYIRNCIDHPGFSEERNEPTQKEIRESIDFMLDTFKRLKEEMVV